jgi:hypothetical protein
MKTGMPALAVSIAMQKARSTPSQKPECSAIKISIQGHYKGILKKSEIMMKI